MLLDWKMKVIKRPKYNDDIKAETWSRKVERLYAYRDFQLKDKEGNIIAIGTSRWIFVDTDRRKPVRLTANIADLYESETDKNVFPEKIEDIECEDYLFKKDYYIQRRDIDINEIIEIIKNTSIEYIDAVFQTKQAINNLKNLKLSLVDNGFHIKLKPIENIGIFASNIYVDLNPIIVEYLDQVQFGNYVKFDLITNSIVNKTKTFI